MVNIIIKYAYDKNGNILYIEDASKENKYFCSKCSSELITKNKGKIREHHFAHKNTVNCRGETIQHIIAKKVILDNKKVRVPEIKFNDCYGFIKKELSVLGINNNFPTHKNFINSLTTECIYKKEQLLIAPGKILIEKKFNNIIPDITFENHIGKPCLFIEIAATHFIETQKKNKLGSLNIPTLEIDLSELIKNDIKDYKIIEEIILNKIDSKHWCTNFIIKNKYSNEIIQKVKNKNMNLLNNFIKKRENKVNLYLKKIAIFDKNYNIKLDHFLKLPSYLNVSTNFDYVFSCDRRIWQCDIFNVFFIKRTNYFNKINIKKIVKYVINSNIYTVDTTNISNVYRAIENFLIILLKNGFFKELKNSEHLNWNRDYDIICKTISPNYYIVENSEGINYKVPKYFLDESVY